MTMPPYAETLGIRLAETEGDELLFVMPFGDAVLGRPGYVHGGALAGLLEIAAMGTVMRALGGEAVTAKQINMTVSYMRGAAAHDTFAAAIITRLGLRVANVEAHAWQQDRAKPVASAQLNLLLKRG